MWSTAMAFSPMIRIQALQTLPARSSKASLRANLAYLQSAAPDNAYVSFLQKNAHTLWTDDRQNRGQLGPNWQGPYFEASAASQSSALDCLVAAAAVSS